MRAKIFLLICLFFFSVTACEEDLPRVNVAVWVEFHVKSLNGDPLPDVDIYIFANKHNLASGKAVGTPFTTTRTTGASGVVEWRGISYNINSEEVIRLAAAGSLTVQNQEYTGEAYIFYNSGDAPGFLKTEVLTIPW